MSKPAAETHIFSVLVENRFGVLARVAGLFSGRNFNIDRLSVAETDDPKVSSMTIVTNGDTQIIEQIEKQLTRLIDVVKVRDLTTEKHVERELALVKVGCDTQERAEILQIVDIFRAKTVDVTTGDVTIEVTGDSDKVCAFLDMLRPYGIKQIVKTGKIAMLRSPMG